MRFYLRKYSDVFFFNEVIVTSRYLFRNCIRQHFLECKYIGYAHVIVTKIDEIQFFGRINPTITCDDTNQTVDLLLFFGYVKHNKERKYLRMNTSNI